MNRLWLWLIGGKPRSHPYSERQEREIDQMTWQFQNADNPDVGDPDARVMSPRDAKLREEARRRAEIEEERRASDQVDIDAEAYRQLQEAASKPETIEYP